MKNTILSAFIAAAFLATASLAIADDDDNNGNVGVNKQGQDQTQSATGGSIGDTSATGGTVKNSGNSSSTGGNSNQGQSTENANNAAQQTSVNVQGDNVSYQAAQIPVATAYAPSIAPTAVCALSLSGGAQGALFGFSMGGSYIDENCEMLEQVRAAKAIGADDVAFEMMMDVPAFAKAAKRIADRETHTTAVAGMSDSTAVIGNKATAPIYTDPIIRDRLGLPSL